MIKRLIIDPKKGGRHATDAASPTMFVLSAAHVALPAEITQMLNNHPIY
jgi:hypothetical protein